ncbi:MAG: hypothetical protein M3Y73_13220 [Actinomycetota bacterium]|nr:hypothetical protein [Actinomycetota bacterium]
MTSKPLQLGRTWQFTVYGGLYELATVRDVLVSAFGRDSKDHDGRSDGQTAMFAFTLDADGCLMENSATLSACSWAISRMESPGPSEPHWLDGFETEEREFILGLNKLVPPKARNTSATALANGTLPKAAKVVAEQAKSAAIDAVGSGAKATGAVVTTAAAAALGAVAGPVVGGIAGAVAGTFAEKLLTLKADGDTTTEPRADTSATDAPGATVAQPKTPRLRMTAKALHEFVADLAAELGVAEVLKTAGIRVKCTEVWAKDTDEVAEQIFLNSFIANDLSRIEDKIRSADIGVGLKAYLTDSRDIPTDQRVDVRSDCKAVVTGVAPQRIPVGRWPTDTGKPLVLSQQFAVNQIRDELVGAAGVFAVNGPPGTGKTTILRDVLVAVSRAKRRLYVIGNRQKWQDHRYFNMLAAALPSPPQPHATSSGPTAGAR